MARERAVILFFTGNLFVVLSVLLSLITDGATSQPQVLKPKENYILDSKHVSVWFESPIKSKHEGSQRYNESNLKKMISLVSGTFDTIVIGGLGEWGNSICNPNNRRKSLFSNWMQETPAFTSWAKPLLEESNASYLIPEQVALYNGNTSNTIKMKVVVVYYFDSSPDEQSFQCAKDVSDKANNIHSGTVDTIFMQYEHLWLTKKDVAWLEVKRNIKKEVRSAALLKYGIRNENHYRLGLVISQPQWQFAVEHSGLDYNFFNDVLEYVEIVAPVIQVKRYHTLQAKDEHEIQVAAILEVDKIIKMFSAKADVVPIVVCNSPDNRSYEKKRNFLQCWKLMSDWATKNNRSVIMYEAFDTYEEGFPPNLGWWRLRSENEKSVNSFSFVEKAKEKGGFVLSSDGKINKNTAIIFDHRVRYHLNLEPYSEQDIRAMLKVISTRFQTILTTHEPYLLEPKLKNVTWIPTVVAEMNSENKDKLGFTPLDIIFTIYHKRKSDWESEGMLDPSNSIENIKAALYAAKFSNQIFPGTVDIFAFHNFGPPRSFTKTLNIVGKHKGAKIRFGIFWNIKKCDQALNEFNYIRNWVKVVIFEAKHLWDYKDEKNYPDSTLTQVFEEWDQCAKGFEGSFPDVQLQLAVDCSNMYRPRLAIVDMARCWQIVSDFGREQHVRVILHQAFDTPYSPPRESEWWDEQTNHYGGWWELKNKAEVRITEASFVEKIKDELKFSDVEYNGNVDGTWDTTLDQRSENSSSYHLSPLRNFSLSRKHVGVFFHSPILNDYQYEWGNVDKMVKLIAGTFGTITIQSLHMYKKDNDSLALNNSVLQVPRVLAAHNLKYANDEPQIIDSILTMELDIYSYCGQKNQRYWSTQQRLEMAKHAADAANAVYPNVVQTILIVHEPYMGIEWLGTCGIADVLKSAREYLNDSKNESSITKLKLGLEIPRVICEMVSRLNSTLLQTILEPVDVAVLYVKNNMYKWEELAPEDSHKLMIASFQHCEMHLLKAKPELKIIPMFYCSQNYDDVGYEQESQFLQCWQLMSDWAKEKNRKIIMYQAFDGWTMGWWHLETRNVSVVNTSMFHERAKGDIPFPCVNHETKFEKRVAVYFDHRVRYHTELRRYSENELKSMLQLVSSRFSTIVNSCESYFTSFSSNSSSVAETVAQLNLETDHSESPTHLQVVLTFHMFNDRSSSTNLKKTGLNASYEFAWEIAKHSNRIFPSTVKALAFDRFRVDSISETMATLEKHFEQKMANRSSSIHMGAFVDMSACHLVKINFKRVSKWLKFLIIDTNGWIKPSSPEYFPEPEHVDSSFRILIKNWLLCKNMFEEEYPDLEVHLAIDCSKIVNHYVSPEKLGVCWKMVSEWGSQNQVETIIYSAFDTFHDEEELNLIGWWGLVSNSEIVISETSFKEKVKDVAWCESSGSCRDEAYSTPDEKGSTSIVYILLMLFIALIGIFFVSIAMFLLARQICIRKRRSENVPEPNSHELQALNR